SRKGAAAREGVVKSGELVRIEKLGGPGMVGVVPAGAAPALPDLFTSLLEDLLIGGVLPLHELLYEPEQPLTLQVRGAFFEGRLGTGLCDGFTPPQSVFVLLPLLFPRLPAQIGRA